MKVRLDEDVLTTAEYGFIYNEREDDLDFGWITKLKRIEYNKHVDAVVFNAVTTSYTSAGVRCAPYTKHRALINLDVAGTPTTLQIRKQFSYNNVNFFDATDLPWSTLFYEDTAGNLDEAVPGNLLAEWVRYVITAVGTTAVNTFTLTLEDLMSNEG